MEATLSNNDRLIVDKLPRTIARITHNDYIPHRGDIIIFKQRNLPGAQGASKTLIKRVIGLPGDRVVVKDGSLIVYNAEHPDGFSPDSGYAVQKPTTGNVDIKLGTGQIFVCGDNRPNSEDSRYFGPIDSDQIIGKLVLRFWPVSKADSF